MVSKIPESTPPNIPFEKVSSKIKQRKQSEKKSKAVENLVQEAKANLNTSFQKSEVKKSSRVVKKSLDASVAKQKGKRAKSTQRIQRLNKEIVQGKLTPDEKIKFGSKDGKHIKPYDVRPKIKFPQESPVGLGRKWDLKGRADLKTKQGPKADAVAFKTAASIISGVSHVDDAILNKIMPEGLSPSENFGKLTASLQGVINEADLKNQDQCEILNLIASCLNKGYAKGIGQFLGDWKPEWGNLGGAAQFKWTQPTDLTWEKAGLTLENMKVILRKADLTEKEWKTKNLTSQDLVNLPP